MREAADAERRILEIGYQRNYNPIYQAAYDGIIKTGTIGDVYHARLAWHRNGNWRRKGEPPAPDYDPSKWGYPTFDHLLQLAAVLEVLAGPDGGAGQPSGERRQLVFGVRAGGGDRFGRRVPFQRRARGLRSRLRHVRISRRPHRDFSSIESNAFDDYYEMFLGTKGTLILLREREALLFEEGGGRQTGIEVTPAGAGAVAQSSETMAAHTNQTAGRPASTTTGGETTQPSGSHTPSASAILLRDSCRHAARVRASQGIWLRPVVHPSQRSHQDEGSHDDLKWYVSPMRVDVTALPLAIAAALTLSAQSTLPYRDASLPVERRVEDLLARMTLEEKVAQTLAVWQQKRGLVDATGAFDPAKAAPILQNGIGQIARPSDGVERGNERRGPRETAEFVNAIQHWVIDNTRLGIPAMFHEEALHGLAAPKGTNFPVPIGLASTWDPALVERVMTSRRARRGRAARSRCSRPSSTWRATRGGGAPRKPTARIRTSSRDMGVAAMRGYQGTALPLTPRPRLRHRQAFRRARPARRRHQHRADAGVRAPAARGAALAVRGARSRGRPLMSVMPSLQRDRRRPSHANQLAAAADACAGVGIPGLGRLRLLRDRAAADRAPGGRLDEARRRAGARRPASTSSCPTAGLPELVELVKSGRVSRAPRRPPRSRACCARSSSPGLFEHPYADPDEPSA